DTVLGRVQPCRDAFRIRPDADEPVIMIAAGTGLAPFRAAVAERAAGLPPALVYFGCDHPDRDYLHADELRAAEATGTVRLRPVFSEAPVDGHRFVQHRIAAEGDEIWDLLDAHARVYVCGDGARMAPGVRSAFRDLYRARTEGADESAAEAWLSTLVAEGRYVEDVYAG
ncbi:reductase, partial [Streptomyces sp. SID5785]|nr:reductase [Streptomyces sp. SID5785]